MWCRLSSVVVLSFCFSVLCLVAHAVDETTTHGATTSVSSNTPRQRRFPKQRRGLVIPTDDDVFQVQSSTSQQHLLRDEELAFWGRFLSSESASFSMATTTTNLPTKAPSPELGRVPDTPPPPPPPTDDLLGLARNMDELDTFVTLVTTAGLQDLFQHKNNQQQPQQQQPMTLLAPTNKAFLSLTGETIQNLHSDMDLLRDVLLYHVLDGVYPATNLTDGQEIPTALPDMHVTVHVDHDDNDNNNKNPPVVSFGPAHVLQPDLSPGGGGLMHVIDWVMMPPSQPQTGAPTVAPTVAPTAAPTTTPTTALVVVVVAGPPTEESNLLDVASQRLELVTFRNLIVTADLEDTLRSYDDDDITLLAPSEYAFDRMDEAIFAELLLNDNDRLRETLLYHVYEGAYPSWSLSDGQVLTSVEGSTTTVGVLDNTASDGTVSFGEAAVTEADILAANGVLHVIDAVLLPPRLQEEEDNQVDFVPETPSVVWTNPIADNDIFQVAQQRRDLVTLVSLISMADLESTLQSSYDKAMTLWAPAERAFDRMDEPLFTKFWSDPAYLRQTLLYHVYHGAWPTTSLTDGQVITSVEGFATTVHMETLDDGTIVVQLNDNAASVVEANILAANGLIHVIDAVLSPP